jgi:hypothetical protein
LLPLPDCSADTALVTRPPLAAGALVSAEAILEYLQGPAVHVWRDLHRVLKPGAHLVCRAGAYTFDLASIGIRSAGFEYRDTIAHQGTPGWEPILLFRKPLHETTVARQVLATGTGALNIEACRIAGAPRTTHKAGNFPNPHTRASSSWGQAFKVGAVAEVPSGRWPANVTLQHAAGCDERGCLDGCPVAQLDGQRRARGEGGKLRTGDSGSCYFEQFRTSQEVLDWLVRLTTPAGGTVVVT